MLQSVLVVDDEPDIVELLRIWFDGDPRCGRVDIATDLAQACELARDHRPDAIVLDFFFGPQTSAETIPALRRLSPSAFIVVHTASRRAAELEGVLELGADLVVEKATTMIDEVVGITLTGPDAGELPSLHGLSVEQQDDGAPAAGVA